jgi:hypothetical protein
MAITSKVKLEKNSSTAEARKIIGLKKVFYSNWIGRKVIIGFNKFHAQYG